MSKMALTTWLYRVLENDDDGDPLDFGAVQANTLEQAEEFVKAHLIKIEVLNGHSDGFGYGQSVEVRFYESTGYKAGVMLTDKLTTVTLSA